MIETESPSEVAKLYGEVMDKIIYEVLTNTGWGCQIKIDDEWKWVSTSDGRRYEYDTEEEAYRVLCMCYPDVIKTNVRTKQI